MANLEFINNNYTQFGDVCALVCYGTVIEYFSQKKIHTEHVLTNYFEMYDLYDQTSEVFYFLKKHKLISDHFHQTSKLQEIKGSTYIKQLHEDDDLGTRDNCKIADIKASPDLIVEKDLFPIRDTLREKDALVMILYKARKEIIDDVLEAYYHAIIIGYDGNQKEFFTKDPNNPRYQIEDIMFQKAIYEYIVFIKNQ